MDKKELLSTITNVLLPAGFKRKGNYWVINGAEITKIVHLQKSQHSNTYYVNYGYIIMALPLNGLMMHIFKRLASTDDSDNKRIMQLLNLDADIPDSERESELEVWIRNKLLSNMTFINNEKDILEELKHRKNLNDVPLIVKNHFGLIDFH